MSFLVFVLQNQLFMKGETHLQFLLFLLDFSLNSNVYVYIMNCTCNCSILFLNKCNINFKVKLSHHDTIILNTTASIKKFHVSTKNMPTIYLFCYLSICSYNQKSCFACCHA